jgi:ABC-type multidrug transport system permease subunit
MMPPLKPLFIETMPSEPIKEIKHSWLEKLWIKFRHWWAWSGGDMFAVLVIGIAVGILMMLRWAR